MPVNTSSTGATYGKSSDPLCPLGFHPQVRWPTRCKRCFRDYKEHNDSGDKKKFGNLTEKPEEDPWTAKKNAFQKSKSVDVTIGDGSAAASRFANYTTAASTSSANKTEEDIPEWKKAMLERRKKEAEEEETKNRNFGFIPGTTLHSSYVNKAYDQDARLSTWGSASNLRSASSYSNLAEEEPASAASSNRNSRDYSTPTSTSSWSKPAAAEKESETLTPYEKYLKRKQEQEKRDEEEKRRADEAKREEERKREREKRREEEKKKEEEAERARTRQRERERETKRREEEAKAKEKEAAEKAEAAKAKTARRWGAGAAPEAPVVKKKPWEKPSATAAKSTLPSLNEAPAKTNSWQSRSQKTSESDSESVSTRKASVHSDSDSEISKPKLEALQNEVKALRSRNEVLEKMHGSSSSKGPLTLESAKASEATSELLKARQKVSEQEASLSTLMKEKKALNLKVKELESTLERRPQVSETQKTISELQTKLKFVEKKCEELNHENEDLKGNVQNLEVELEEVQDNFREDEVDEYRTLKRELENSAKNCRVLQFKLKKAEKSLVDVTEEKSDLEKRIKSISGGSSGLENLNKIRALEKELDSKNMQINRLEAESKTGKSLSGGPRKGGPGPVLSRTGSVERNVEDQLLKDLQDSIERENDLKEQLNMAEEESAEMRKKLSRFEDENESLASQVKKMAIKTKRRSPSPYGRNSYVEKDEGISEDGEELSPTELKVQLEVAEGETNILRKKVENLLTENLKITKEVKELTGKLNEEKKKKSTSSFSSYGSSRQDSSANEKKIDELQTEVNTFRVKLIEKDRELERLDAQIKSSKSSGKSLIRSGSQDEDLLKKLNVIEKEAEVLRKKTAELEQENENLKTESKKLHSGYGKKPASTQEKLQMDKFTLEEKVKGLEQKLKEANRKASELEDTGRSTMKINLEMDRLKREKSSLESEVAKLKEAAGSEKRKFEKMERDLSSATGKAEKAQREIIAAEREKRRAVEEKSGLEAQIGRLETDLRSVTREKDRFKDESESARQKNRENLSQTQEGMKAFKDQIDILKQELSDEKKASREYKRQLDEKSRLGENEVAGLKKEIERKSNDLEDKIKKLNVLEEKSSDIEEKLAKSKRINQQRKDKIEKLEKELENSSGTGSKTVVSAKLSAAETKIADLERQLEEKSSKGGSSLEAGKLKKEVEKLTKEKQEITAIHEQLEEDYVILKAKLSTDKDDDLTTLQGELSTLRHTYNNKSDEWIKEKLDLEKKVKDLEQSIRSSAGNGWDAERNRFKSILDDRDSQITSLKIECDVARSQHSSVKKELEDVKQKLSDYEKMNRYGKSATESNSSSDVSSQVEELKKQLSIEQKERKSDLNNTKMKYDSKIAIMSEELHALKSQASKYRRERETYKEMFEGVQKKLTDSKGGKISAGDTASELITARSKISDMSYQLHVLEDELSEAKMEQSKAQANLMTTKSHMEIQIAELNSKINEMEEEALIDSGRARIAGTRTKMELAWQKERESQKKLINELNTMSRDLKSTLLEVEKEKERDRLDSKRKLEGMKRAFEEEQDDTKKQITDLQYDLLELRDAHAKLRTTNEKLRREKDRSVDDVRIQSKTRSEYGEEKKIKNLISDMDEFLSIVPKFLGNDIMEKEEKSGRASRHDNEKSLAKMEFKTALFRVKETKEELEQLQRITEEEIKRRSRRGESIETINEESPRGRSGMRNASHSASSQKRALYRKAVSMGEGMAENSGNLWQSKESLGSNESMASNASIPLPVPVRTRSNRGGSESGYSSDTYNAMTIRRLERDTSVDRLSTGSRESTQSEWLPGEKKKSKGLLGKLKKIGRSLSTERTNEAEREFGSGSDISSVSQQSKMSTSSKVSTASKMIARARSASKDRAADKDKKTPFGPPGNANAAFDKYFDKAATPAAATASLAAGARAAAVRPATARPAAAAATPKTTAASTTPAVAPVRTYRRY